MYKYHATDKTTNTQLKKVILGFWHAFVCFCCVGSTQHTSHAPQDLVAICFIICSNYFLRIFKRLKWNAKCFLFFSENSDLKRALFDLITGDLGPLLFSHSDSRLGSPRPRLRRRKSFPGTTYRGLGEHKECLDHCSLAWSEYQVRPGNGKTQFLFLGKGMKTHIAFICFSVFGLLHVGTIADIFTQSHNTIFLPSSAKWQGRRSLLPKTTRQAALQPRATA